jgi:hypothetical protein
MHRTSDSGLAMLVIVLATTVLLGQAPVKPTTAGEATKTEDFATAIKRLRETWVREFNAGHADKVAALYPQEAVLMRRNGSVHNSDSILAELQRSLTAEAHNYTVQSLHTERSGDRRFRAPANLRLVSSRATNKRLSSYFGIALGFLLVSTKLIPHRG